MANKELKMNLFIFLVFLSISFSPNHAFTFDIIAPYHPIPLFEQFLFFLTDISPFSAKDFLQEVLSNYSSIDDTDFLCNLAESYISPSYHQLMYAQIENGYYLPRGEMFREIAINLDNNSDLIISDNSDNFTFSNDEKKNHDIHFTSDIVFGSSNIYVYANLHNKTIASEILLMITSKASFILRPFSNCKSTNSKLTGFGFELSADNNHNIKKEDDLISDEYVKYKTVTDETIGRLNGIPPSYINPILYQRLGPKFANFLQRRRNDTLPELLRDITSNYPLFLPLILSTHETKEDQYSYQKVSTLLEGKIFSMSFLNGRHIELSQTNLFNLFDILHQEHNFNAILERKYKIDNQLINDITKSQMIPTDNLIIDYRSPYIIYINDLENDIQYSNWTTNLNEIFNITAKYPQIKKNLINLILYANPTTQEGATSLFEIVVMMQKEYPIRFGFMPFFNLDNKFERKVAYAFNYFASQNTVVAIQYLINVFEKIGINRETNKLNPVNRKFYKTEFNRMAKSVNSEITWNMLFFLYDPESVETQRLIETNRYLKEHGITKQTVLINGRYIQTPTFSPALLNIELHATYLILQTLIRQHNLINLAGKNETDIFDFQIKTMPTIKSIDQRIYFTLPKGIDIFSKKLPIQVEFNDFLSKINWNFFNGNKKSNGEDASSFVWLFCPDNTDLTVFYKFMKSNNLSEPIMFALNPKIPDSVYPINKSIVTLIYNGRIYENADINDFQFLVNLDSWSHHFVSKPLSSFFYKLKFKRRECLVYLSCVYIDWMMNGVSRGSIPDNVWNLNSSLIYNPHEKNGHFGLTWELIVDPFSSDFQKVAPIINYFNKRKIIDFRFVLVPPVDASQTEDLRTMSSFYRMSIGEDKTCVFTLLNSSTSYSVVPHLPDSWLIENLRASFDTSGIQIDKMKPGIHSALFVLSSLVIEGRCLTQFGEVAEGAEISLFESISKELSDTTTIMKMNGYWQLKANHPGQFSIDVTGVKSKLIFQKVALDLLISSFSTVFRRIELTYNPSFIRYQVKDITKSHHHLSKPKNNEYLNVFSVVDGFESEEKVTKMIISIIRNTKSPQKVKFWFIRSFLSPQFKATLQKLALKHSIIYCLTDYKWPKWLKCQSIRSNNACAFKLLFLDLIFKGEKGRVLYMDPTNFVRDGIDIYKLFQSYSFVDNDYYSDPTLAFPSFSDTRIESDPLRFWKNDYWLSFLQGKQFIDPSLFLLDLKRYKENGSADLLRYIYQIISPDPTTKSTLDQNLINFIRVQMPMKILPDSYYGCDLWNDDKSMENVKIVNLCYNPYSKLSEFNRAAYYINDWPVIQNEVNMLKSRNDEFMAHSFKKQKDLLSES